MIPYENKIICYNCIHWDGDNQYSQSDGNISNVWVSICSCPDKWRISDKNEDHITEAQDFCLHFEPVSGWDDNWKAIFERRLKHE